MLNFLKVFIRGIVCTVLLPAILVVWVLYGVYCLIVFVIMLVKSLILFFMGDSAAGEMKEDLEAKRMLLEQEQAQSQAASMMNMMYQNAMAQMQAQQAAPASYPQQPSTEPVVPQNNATNFEQESSNVNGEGDNDEHTY